MTGETDLLRSVSPEAAGQRLDRFLAAHLERTSRSQVQRAIRLGLVIVDGVTAVKTGASVQEGQEISYTSPPVEPSAAVPQDIPLNVLFEDDHLVVVNKAAGMVVHPAPGHPDGTLVNALLGRYPELTRLGALRPGIVHRLDRGTSGAIVVAKDDRTREGLSEQFLNRSLFKGYLAITLSAPREEMGTIDEPIGRHPSDRKRFSTQSRVGRAARSAYHVHGRAEGLGVLGVRIFTGRTHQIRVHLRHLHCPVAGDDLYAPRWAQQPFFKRPAMAATCADGPLLHAARLAFTHPITHKPLDLIAPLPDRFVTVLNTLDPTLASELAADMADPEFFGGDNP